ncbi:MAG: hypothetical protein AAGJ38_10700, partial [Planctomycetota bacterium]
WEPIYTRFVKEQDGHRFYRTRGFQSVFVFDADAYQNYAVQAVADNCLMESFDNGYSWAMRTKPGVRTTSRSNSVRILRELDPPLVLAHTETGWGGNAYGGTLWGKRLRTFTPKDEWVMLAGGDNAVAGLPDHLFEPITPDPHQPGRVYIGTGARGEGVFVIDDIEALMDAAENGSERPRFRQVSGEDDHSPKRVTYYAPGLVVDPLREDVLWAGEANRKIWKGVRSADGTWDWDVVLEGSTAGRFAVWAMGDHVVITANQVNAEGDSDLVISTDDGETWQTLLTVADVEPLRDEVWYHDGWDMEPAGIVGDGNRVFFSYVSPSPGARRVLGFFEAQLNEDATLARVVDHTDDLGWPYPVATRIVERVPGVRELYMATRGKGLWRRPLP